MGIGCWVKTPGDLLLSHDMAKKAVQYRYLLGGCLLLDMEEHKTENGISLYETLEQLTDALKTGKKESMELCLARMEEEIKGRSSIKAVRACIFSKLSVPSGMRVRRYWLTNRR